MDWQAFSMSLPTLSGILEGGKQTRQNVSLMRDGDNAEASTTRHSQLVHDLLQVVGLHLAGHDLHHLLADLAHLLVLGVRGLADLVGALLGEAHAKETQEVAVRGLHVHVSLDHGLPLLDHRAHLVTGQVHAVEVGEAVLALHVLRDQLELAEGHLVVLQVGKAHLEHTTLQTV